MIKLTKNKSLHIKQLEETIFAHKKQVGNILMDQITEIEKRALNHDDSKFSEEELEAFIELENKFKNENLKFGAYGYIKNINAIEHHHKNNSHHPEYYKNGIAGMDILDLLETFADWASYSNTIEEFEKKLEFNQKRFNISDDLISIFKNSFKKLKSIKEVNNEFRCV